MAAPLEIVAEFDTRFKADVSCSALLDAGIRAEVREQLPNGVSWDFAALGLYQVVVPASAVDRALDALEAAFGANGERLDELQDEVDG